MAGSDTRRGFWPLRKILKAILLFSALVLLPIALWLCRVPIASVMIQQQCTARNLECSFQIDRLSLWYVEVSKIRAATDEGVPFEVGTVDLKIGWPAFLKPSFEHIRIDSASVRARYRGSNFDFYGADLSAGDGGGSVSLEQLSVHNGRFEIVTDAGPLEGSFAFNGDPAADFSGNIRIEPSQIVYQGAEISISQFAGQARRVSGNLSGKFAAVLDRVQQGEYSVEDLRIDVTAETEAQQYKINVDGAAESISTPSIEGSEIVGRLEADMSKFLNLVNPEASLENVVGDLSAREVRLNSLKLDEIGGQFSAERHQGVFDGVLQVGLSEADNGEISLVGGNVDAAFSTNTFLPNKAKGSLSARFSLEDVTYGRPLSFMGGWEATWPGPLSDYATKGRLILERVASRFDVEFEGELSFDQTEGAYLLEAYETAKLKADSGLKISVGAPDSRAWLTADRSQIQMFGVLSVVGTDGLNFVAEIPALRADASLATFEAELRDVWLSPFVAGKTEASFRLNELTIDKGDGLKVRADGRFSMDGLLFDAIDLTGTDLVGAFEIVNDSRGLLIHTISGDCAKFTAEEVALDNYRWVEAIVPLCPKDGRLLRKENDRTYGRLPLGILPMQIITESLSANVDFRGAKIDWEYLDAFSMEFVASSLEADGMMGESPITMAGVRPRIELTVSDRGPLIGGSFEGLEFVHEGLPFRVNGGSVEFAAKTDLDGLVGDFALNTAELLERNPAFELKPVLLSGDGELRTGVVEFSGDLMLASEDVWLGKLEMTHDLGNGAGGIRLRTAELVFHPAGLQPKAISERLRGLAVDLDGQAGAEVALNWREEGLEADGQLHFDDLTFETLRLGRIAGLSGVVTFADLLEMRTPPSQTLSIDRIELTPRVSLLDGEIEFELLGPGHARLQRAEWPFVGGYLQVLPTEWQTDSKRQTVTVIADRWDLDTFLSQFELPDIEAEGTASGQFPISFENGNVLVENAELKVEGGGKLRYSGTIGDGAGQANEYARLSFNALKDFRYSVLSIGASGNLAGDVLLQISLLGHNPAVLEGQQFEFNVTLDSKLASLLQSGSLITGTDAITDAILKDLSAE